MWQRLTVLAGMVLATVLGTVAVPMTAVAAPSLDVFVGYADTLRANPTQFPTPWDGAPDVIFAGCHVNCSFDAGAARFVNNSGVSTPTAGYPWLFKDTELTGTVPAHATPEAGLGKWRDSFGGSFTGGVLFMFGDGTVRMVNYNQRGTPNLARLLYPSDGAVASIEN